jgi:putative aldouronate transport system substrate-binding protein
MKKNIIVLFWLFTGCVFSFAGGSRSGGGAIPSDPGPFGKYKDTLSVSTAKARDPTVEFNQNDPEKRSFEENRWMQTYLDKLNIKTTYKWISPDEESYNTKWIASIAAGDIPDYCVVNGSVYKLLYEAGFIADMREPMNAYASDRYKNYLSDLDYQALTIDNKLLGLPFPNIVYEATTCLFIRRDWLDKLGLQIPRSIEDVIAVARAFKAAKLGGPDTIGLFFSRDSTGGINAVGADGKWDGFMNGHGAYLNYWLEKNGSLVYSNIQPEMRTALLAMQVLYKDGTINRDFASVDTALGQEYIAGGKAGIFYSTAWETTLSLQTLHHNDPSADIINIFPPSLQGKKFPVQTNSPRGVRIFVSNKMRNPEAVVKIVNLCLDLIDNDQHNYGFGEDGFAWFKYSNFPYPGNNTFSLDQAHAIRVAEKIGDTSLLKSSGVGWYESYKLAKEGKSDWWYLATMGEGGSWSTVYDAFHSNMILNDGFLGLPTATMALKGTTVNDVLNTAMFEVIMGADISVYDRAIEQWKVNGGQQITDEVNAWYRGVKGNK